MELTEEELKLVEELTGIISEQDKLGDESPKQELEAIITEKIYGSKMVDKRVNIWWWGLFNEGECPVCKEKIEKKGGEYLCPKCGLKIQAELYDKAKEQDNKEAELDEKESKLRKRMDEIKLTKERINEIYSLAMERSEKIGKKDET